MQKSMKIVSQSRVVVTRDADEDVLVPRTACPRKLKA
jgi:hypothetical protein